MNKLKILLIIIPLLMSMSAPVVVSNEYVAMDIDEIVTMNEYARFRMREIRKSRMNEIKEEEPVLEELIFDMVGTMTAYQAGCEGCSGVTAAGVDVRGTIHYEDLEFGTVRIVAAPPEIPMHSIIRVHNTTLSPFLVIVLDRGGAIKEGTFDLLKGSQGEAISFGRQYSVGFEILRWGR